jgi:fumarate hydratase class II
VAADLTLRRKHYYKRPGVDAFVAALADSGRFEVAVYSSMMRHNILDGLDALIPAHSRHVAHVLDRCAAARASRQ